MVPPCGTVPLFKELRGEGGVDFSLRTSFQQPGGISPLTLPSHHKAGRGCDGGISKGLARLGPLGIFTIVSFGWLDSLTPRFIEVARCDSDLSNCSNSFARYREHAPPKRSEEAVETVTSSSPPATTPLKRGANETILDGASKLGHLLGTFLVTCRS